MAELTNDENTEALRQLAGEMDKPGLEMMTQVMYSNARESEWVANVLREGDADKIARLEAKLEMIQTRIRELYSHPWTPQAHLVIAALYPMDYEVDEWLASKAEAP